jgi:hypothetical protein
MNWNALFRPGNVVVVWQRVNSTLLGSSPVGGLQVGKEQE